MYTVKEEIDKNYIPHKIKVQRNDTYAKIKKPKPKGVGARSNNKGVKQLYSKEFTLSVNVIYRLGFY